MDEMLKVEGLTKKYKDFTLEDVSFSLPPGYIMGLVGANGAGKTTVIKLILNMIRAASGEVTVFGKSNSDIDMKENIGVVFDGNYFVEDWTGLQAGRAVGMFHQNWNEQKFRELLARFEIDGGKKVKELSKGMQMKLMLGCAMSYDAKLLILDEPTSGLDPVSRDELLELLAEYIEDGLHSVLFSTHITQDLEKAADFITCLCRGKLVYTGGKDEFIDGFRIVRGGREELTPEIEKELIGLRVYSTGFEGLMQTENAARFRSLHQEPATIDQIIVFMNKGGNS